MISTCDPIWDRSPLLYHASICPEISFPNHNPFFPSFVSSNGNSGGKSANPPALCQWSEVPNHPGLVCCLTQTTSIPVLLMVEPDRISIQEIKTLPAKAKVCYS